MQLLSGYPVFLFAKAGNTTLVTIYQENHKVASHCLSAGYHPCRRRRGRKEGEEDGEREKEIGEEETAKRNRMERD